MRCKNHGTDLSSIIGVCATCLRERLFKLILSQEQSQAQSQAQSLQQKTCNSNTIPSIPRSVSPYINHRKSVTNSVTTVHRPFNKPHLNHSISEKRFYNSPQIAFTNGGCIGSSSSNRKKPMLVRFPSISHLFRSNSRNGNRNSRNGGSDSNSRASVSSSNDPYGAGVVRKQRCVSDRGMSPVRTSDDDEISDGPAESCKRTPSYTAVRRGGQKSVTDLIFCPLVSASSHRLLNEKGRPSVDCGVSGEARVSVVPHISYAKSFSGNRSRKLVDFGRSDPNR